MCIDRKLNIPVKFQNKQKVFMGWKVFSRSKFKDGKFGLYYNITDTSNIDKWIHNKSKLILMYNYDYKLRYDCGYHIVLTRKDARYYNEYDGFTLKVYFKNVTSFGIQRNVETVVAQDIFIPSFENRYYWPKK